MRRAFASAVLVLLILTMESCEEIIGIDDDLSSTPHLVVEGGINNLPPPYKIKLSTSTDLAGVGTNVLGTGASITLFDSMGNSEELVEFRNGLYQTSGVIQGEVGSSYRIDIKLANGDEYSSSFDKIPEPVVVGDVYNELVRENIVNDDLIVVGQSIYHDIFAEVVNDPSRQIYLKSTLKLSITERMIGLGTGCEDFGPVNCFSFRKPVVSEVNIASNDMIDDEVLTMRGVSVPIVFKGLFYAEFDIESLSKEAFEFYSAIKEQLDREGTLFDPLIPRVPTNMVSSSNKQVDGFFKAYSISKAEICYDRSKVSVRVDIPSACDFCVNVLAPATNAVPPQLVDCEG